MSAWIVSRDHLDLLITAALAWELTTAEQADEIGRMLWKENLTSVAYRYPHDSDGERPGPSDFRDHHVDAYHFHRYPGRVDPEVVAAAASSLAYQSCEHPGWLTTDASAWVTGLRAQAHQRIPAYLAEHGPVDPNRQRPGEYGWYVLVDLDGNRQIKCGDGWSVPDRDVFTRAATLRTTSAPQLNASDEPTAGPR